MQRTLPEKAEWLIIGDFNQVLKQSDKVSDCCSKISGAEALRDCLNTCSLVEVKAQDAHYTWFNNREPGRRTWERLDRAFANPAWIRKFEEAVVTNLPISVSDHGPMIIQLERSLAFKKRPYRFELMWTTHPQCKRVIEEAWNNHIQGSPAYRLSRKLMITKSSLKEWNKKVFGNIHERKRKLEAELMKLQVEAHKGETIDREKMVRNELDTVLEQEQILWMQKSRQNWIVRGDRNTRFFHTVTSKRRARNKIRAIRKDNGMITESQEEIEKTIEDSFLKLFQDRIEVLQKCQLVKGFLKADNPAVFNLLSFTCGGEVLAGGRLQFVDDRLYLLPRVSLLLLLMICLVLVVLFVSLSEYLKALCAGDCFGGMSLCWRSTIYGDGSVLQFEFRIFKEEGTVISHYYSWDTWRDPIGSSGLGTLFEVSPPSGRFIFSFDFSMFSPYYYLCLSSVFGASRVVGLVLAGWTLRLTSNSFPWKFVSLGEAHQKTVVRSKARRLGIMMAITLMSKSARQGIMVRRGEEGVDDLKEESSDEESGGDNLAVEVEVVEPVRLNLNDPPHILKDQLKVYHKYCLAKFAECSIKLQKRAEGWYAFQVRRGNINKFPGPDNNRKCQPSFFSVEIREGIEWELSVQWWVRHSAKNLCHRTRLYLCGLMPPPDAYDKMHAMDVGAVGPLAIDGVHMIVNARQDEGREFIMSESEEDYVEYVIYNLINGKLELDPNAVVPEASSQLIEEELDPGKGLMAHAVLGERSARSLLPFWRSTLSARSKEAQDGRSNVVGYSGARVNFPFEVERWGGGFDVERRSQEYSFQEWRTRVGWSGGHSLKACCYPPKDKSKTSLDFLCSLMARSLKLAEPKEVEIFQSMGDDKCAASIVAYVHQVNYCRSPLFSFLP
ncbi:Endonuclease/exonuclease/phosphatase [Corchorus olitorius]|uniref:Endonuclease/exonuclease/phosphatase n=1 Tax=Corchorus olitorius TaxID=93759 RepID=A0A1R3JHV3_9ROSI|nr:Endonuclease/exonuclease/phosphatase [Corchorus olitorius]